MPHDPRWLAGTQLITHGPPRDLKPYSGPELPLAFVGQDHISLQSFGGPLQIALTGSQGCGQTFVRQGKYIGRPEGRGGFAGRSTIAALEPTC